MQRWTSKKYIENADTDILKCYGTSGKIKEHTQKMKALRTDFPRLQTCTNIFRALLRKKASGKRI